MNLRRLSRTFLAVTALSLVSARAESPIQDGFVRIESSKQGVLKGEAVDKGRLDWSPIRSFGYAVVSPTDPSTGMATGRTQFGQISFAKDWGAASPMLFQAIATNEALKSVVFEFTYATKEGDVEVFYRVTLTNARIVNFRQVLPLDGSRPLDSVSLAYQSIEVESVTGKTTGTASPGDLAARSVQTAFGLSYSMVDGAFRVELPDEEVELDFLDLQGGLVRSIATRGGNVRFDAGSLGIPAGMYLLQARVAGRALGTVPVSIAR